VKRERGGGRDIGHETSQTRAAPRSPASPASGRSLSLIQYKNREDATPSCNASLRGEERPPTRDAVASDWPGLRKLTGIPSSFALSPGGRQIALEGFEGDTGPDPEIYVINSDGTGLRQLTDNTREDISTRHGLRTGAGSSSRAGATATSRSTS
jgi:hypothetical protein